MTPTLVIEMTNVTKRHSGLRPLRVAALQVRQGDHLLLSGFDAAAAEVFVHLVTGAAVPDEGEIRIAGRNTRDIATDTEWLTSLDRFGLVTERAVLLEGLSVAANLALPLTLAIDPMPDDVRTRVAALAADVGLSSADLDTTAGTMSAEARVRLHLGRAMGSAPDVLLLEHPTARLDAAAAASIGRTVKALASARQLAYVALTEDDGFMRAAGGTRLRLNPATGALAADGFWRRAFAGRIGRGSHE